MINILNALIVLLFIAIVLPNPGSSQDSSTHDLRYEVNRVYPYISITKDNLNKAHTLVDLNKHYKPSWVREYILVEILTNNKGRVSKAVSKTDTLSQQQKDIMNMADVGTRISVKVLYIPENTLTHNDIKEFDFTFTAEPQSDASYSGGKQQLNRYLKEIAIDKIPDASFTNYDIAAIKFTINKDGQIIDAYVFWSSEDEIIDELLLETICNMPTWAPAEYSNGIKVKQDFVLTVGNMENCMMYLLNIRRD